MHLVGITIRHPRLKIRGKTFVILPKQAVESVAEGCQLSSGHAYLSVLPPTCCYPCWGFLQLQEDAKRPFLASPLTPKEGDFYFFQFVFLFAPFPCLPAPELTPGGIEMQTQSSVQVFELVGTSVSAMGRLWSRHSCWQQTGEDLSGQC